MIDVLDPNTSAVLFTATTNGTGHYSITVASGIYTIRVTPPAGSQFQVSLTPNQSIAANTVDNFTLVSAAAVTVSGHVLDGLGQGIPSFPVRLNPAGGGTALFATTDANGAYSFQVAPGSYSLRLAITSGAGSSPIPNFMDITSTGFTVTGNLALELALPLKRVTVHVQDPGGTAVAGASVTTNTFVAVAQTTTIAGLGFFGNTHQNFGVATNAAGDATLWLFPPNSGNPYTLSVSPPSGSPFASFSLPGVTFSSDISEITILQFVHVPPVTTTTTTPLPNGAGNFVGPVTVTLAATAANGFTVASILYSVDGGSNQTYTAPFVVTGNGLHTVTYNATDSAGVFELSKTLNLNIVPISLTPTPSRTPTSTTTPTTTATATSTATPTNTPQPGLQITTSSPLPSGTVGQPYSVTFHATGGTPGYTWSVFSGLLPPGLNLDPNSGILSGTPNIAGTFGFTIQVRDSSGSTAQGPFIFSPPSLER
jgi:hypothetical protein